MTRKEQPEKQPKEQLKDKAANFVVLCVGILLSYIVVNHLITPKNPSKPKEAPKTEQPSNNPQETIKKSPHLLIQQLQQEVTQSKLVIGKTMKLEIEKAMKTSGQMTFQDIGEVDEVYKICSLNYILNKEGKVIGFSTVAHCDSIDRNSVKLNNLPGSDGQEITLVEKFPNAVFIETSYGVTFVLFEKKDKNALISHIEEHSADPNSEIPNPPQPFVIVTNRNSSDEPGKKYNRQASAVVCFRLEGFQQDGGKINILCSERFDTMFGFGGSYQSYRPGASGSLSLFEAKGGRIVFASADSTARPPSDKDGELLDRTKVVIGQVAPWTSDLAKLVKNQID